MRKPGLSSEEETLSGDREWVWVFSSPPCGLLRYKRFTDRVFVCGTCPWHFPTHKHSLSPPSLPLPTQVLDLYGSYQEVSLSSINIYPTNRVDSGAVCIEGPSAHAVGWMNAGWSTGAADHDCSTCLPPLSPLVLCFSVEGRYNIPLFIRRSLCPLILGNSSAEDAVLPENWSSWGAGTGGQLVLFVMILNKTNQLKVIFQHGLNLTGRICGVMLIITENNLDLSLLLKISKNQGHDEALTMEVNVTIFRGFISRHMQLLIKNNTFVKTFVFVTCVILGFMTLRCHKKKRLLRFFLH